MEYLDSLNKSWIEILIEPSSKYPLIEPKPETLTDLFEILEEIRKLNVAFDSLKINFYDLDLIPLQNAIFDHDYKLVNKLKESIKNKLVSYASESKIKTMLANYKRLLEDLSGYTVSDLYKIEKDIEEMTDEDFDDIFSKKAVLEGISDIIKAMREEGAIDNDIGSDPNAVAEFKRIYDAYYFEVVKAKTIADFLSSII